MNLCHNSISGFPCPSRSNREIFAGQVGTVETVLHICRQAEKAFDHAHHFEHLSAVMPWAHSYCNHIFVPISSIDGMRMAPEKKGWVNNKQYPTCLEKITTVALGSLGKTRQDPPPQVESAYGSEPSHHLCFDVSKKELPWVGSRQMHHIPQISNGHKVISSYE